ncbi:transcriptional regulator GutM [Lactiplantibacillus songbeiensis]|uniref:Transcriptional regulator GutM n=1 Tax=Lactiplantibacillus songbeiensis TaxID=2559920 RepID=A0ABW4C144_9LACO|nr:transcriptional regulator GutM [Lactiplantibacillus songbeiensis]
MSGLSFVLFLMVIIISKQALSILNSRIYVSEYRNVVQNNLDGYLGVGTFQPKLGVGQVCLVVIDRNGVINDCRLIKGISIFARFHKYTPVIARSITDEVIDNDQHHKVLLTAIEHAQQQIN